MKKDELKALLLGGEPLSVILPFTDGQDCLIFKADAFRPGDEILYIPDFGLNEIPAWDDLSADVEWVNYVIECCYSGNDFIEECGGDVRLAEELFHYCDWQHPSSALPEVKDCMEEMEDD